jgi:ubiquitin-protein ligase
VNLTNITADIDKHGAAGAAGFGHCRGNGARNCVGCAYTSTRFAVGTPFEGGLFQCKLVLGSDFPTVPPKGP